MVGDWWFVIGAATAIALAGTDHSTAQVATELRQQFQTRLERIASAVNGVVGYDIVDLTSGEHISRLQDQIFPTASAIKVGIVYELFKQSADGRIKLDESMPLDRSKAVGGSGVLVHMGTPTLTIRDYAVLMVTLSDNTATNVLIDRLGMAAITKRMEQLGLANTKLRRHMMDGAAARRGDENVSTPGELASLMKSIQSLPDAVALLKLPKENRLRRGLPPGVESADKSGELDGVRADIGVVFAKNRPYVFSVMTTYLRDEDEGERAIVEMSRAAYEYFERLGTSGVAGRRIGR